MPPHTIEEVIARLEAVIDDALRGQRRIGYFAALYERVTSNVRRALVAGDVFRDNPRMERLDVVFADRFLAAWDAYRGGREPTASWRVAFSILEDPGPLVVQHLMLGMNAHINLDLAIAAAETAPGADIHALQGDFDEINRILVARIDDVQDRIADVSPWMWVLDTVGERTDEALCGYCIARAREISWENALRLAPLSPAERADEVRRSDLLVAALAIPLERPGPLARAALLCARVRETQDVGRVLDALAS